MKLVDAVDFKSGVVEFDIFIDIAVPICDQEMLLSEDMFQVVYRGGSVVIDLGWTPALDCNGDFRILLVQDFNWQEPVRAVMTNDVQVLIKVVRECVDWALEH